MSDSGVVGPGDASATKIGCIATPEITRHRLQPGDSFVVLASDGLFDFVSNEQVTL